MHTGRNLIHRFPQQSHAHALCDRYLVDPARSCKSLVTSAPNVCEFFEIQHAYGGQDTNCCMTRSLKLVHNFFHMQAHSTCNKSYNTTQKENQRFDGQLSHESIATIDRIGHNARRTIYTYVHTSETVHLKHSENLTVGFVFKWNMVMFTWKGVVHSNFRSNSARNVRFQSGIGSGCWDIDWHTRQPAVASFTPNSSGSSKWHKIAGNRWSFEFNW